MAEATEAVGTSPLIAQYLSLKQPYPEALLLSRVGDFYEAYGDDAVELAQALTIVCTSKEAGKGKRVAMSGVPHHSVDHYLGRLLRQRRIVAIAEQMEEPVPNRLVRREIVRVLTPGTLLEEQFLTPERNNYVCAIATAAGFTAVAACDISTSQATVSVVDDDDALAAELDRLAPSEMVLATEEDEARYKSMVSESCKTTVRDPFDSMGEGVQSGNGQAAYASVLREMALAQRPAGHEAMALLERYLHYVRIDAAGVLRHTTVHETRKTMAIDRSTRRHLDLLSGSSESRSASLLNVLAKTETAMGSRLLAQWLCAPLLDIERICDRHDRVEALFDRIALRAQLQRGLRRIGDIQRLMQKIAARRAGPRDLAGLAASLRAALAVAADLRDEPASLLSPFAQAIAAGGACADVVSLLTRALVDEPAATLTDGGVFRVEYDEELCQLSSLRSAARDHLIALEGDVRAQSGLKGLKIRYTQAFGYYYEVTRSQAHAVPADFIRRQSLVNAERFTDARLKELEAKLLTARACQVALERRLFEALVDQLDSFRDPLQAAAESVAQLDVYCSLAQVAAERRYVRPTMTAESMLDVTAGRHAIVEAYGVADFVPNECSVDDTQRFLLITGPNMGGKSTYLRQTALICVMAQMGSFVPAARAKLGLIDRLYTRIGAGDDIAAGRSTFYVEMSEMALILRHCTRHSLLLIDEVGRGTGTIDGLSIAQSISEYLLELDTALPIVLFATHFHELVKLSDAYARVLNLHVAVAEEPAGPVFSHRVVPGSSSRSYGIAVATMAGLPRPIVDRAKAIAAELEARPGVEMRGARSPARAGRSAEAERQLHMEMP
ncbi:MAG: DNA mismatch repair protein MutS [Candidatus Eremiobacter antarcticus]|nr:DNA mismatch repair protein MutS [Candidatus Eremiobacteraeota bacterium]MBC5808596.1 DNA mismatch repair protein MutS [Candidatus Eremiobacteraeota bacterium]